LHALPSAQRDGKERRSMINVILGLALVGLTWLALRTDAHGNLNTPAVAGIVVVLVVFYLSNRGAKGQGQKKR
jgi:hypothetical protein